MTTKANRNRDAQKRIKKALSQHGITPVNPDNWLMRFAASPWCLGLAAAAMVGCIVVLIL